MVQGETEALEKERHLGHGPQDHEPTQRVALIAGCDIVPIDRHRQEEPASPPQALAKLERSIKELSVGDVHDDGGEQDPVVGRLDVVGDSVRKEAGEQAPFQLGVIRERTLTKRRTRLHGIHLDAQRQKPYRIASASWPYLQDAFPPLVWACPPTRSANTRSLIGRASGVACSGGSVRVNTRSR